MTTIHLDSGFPAASPVLLAAVLAALCGCVDQDLLEAQEAVRNELDMLRARLTRLEADTGRQSRKIQRLTDKEEELAKEDGPEPVTDLTVVVPTVPPDATDDPVRETGTEERSTEGTGELASDPFARDVQIALKRAHFDPGPVDGKAGAMTKKAIREFQRENNLPETGVADEATWDHLRRYLE